MDANSFGAAHPFPRKCVRACGEGLTKMSVRKQWSGLVRTADSNARWSDVVFMECITGMEIEKQTSCYISKRIDRGVQWRC